MQNFQVRAYTMTVKTELVWGYQPLYIFEECFVAPLSDGKLIAHDGKAILSLPTATDPVLSEHLLAIKDEVLAIFEIRQLISHRMFELNEPQIIQYEPNGARSVSVSITGAIGTVACGNADVIGTDSDGNIVHNAKAERLVSETEFITSLTSKMLRSSTLRAMVRSYGQAVRDHRNELVHLYEIRDTVCNHFGSEMAARSALRISRDIFSILRQLANDKPLREGRHRGKKIADLRPATKAELAEARRIAQIIVKSFAETV